MTQKFFGRPGGCAAAARIGVVLIAGISLAAAAHAENTTSIAPPGASSGVGEYAELIAQAQSLLDGITRRLDAAGKGEPARLRLDGAAQKAWSAFEQTVDNAISMDVPLDAARAKWRAFTDQAMSRTPLSQADFEALREHAFRNTYRSAQRVLMPTVERLNRAAQQLQAAAAELERAGAHLRAQGATRSAMAPYRPVVPGVVRPVELDTVAQLEVYVRNLTASVERFGGDAAQAGRALGDALAEERRVLDRIAAVRAELPLPGDRGETSRPAPARVSETQNAPETIVPSTTPPIGEKREYNAPSQPSTAKQLGAEQLEKVAGATCLANPLSCCPAGQKSGAGCKLVAEGMLDIRIRSYVPPRFTIMGKNRPWGPDFHLANIVADKTVGGPFPVHPGCRFNVNQAKHAIEDSKNVLEQALDLAEAWLSQWSGGVEAAKSFVADGVAGGVCGVVDDSDSCRSTVGSAIKSGINAGLASLGIPPELPDIHELRENGIKYLASQAASYAVGELGAMGELPVDDAARQALYDAAYDKASGLLAAELNKVVPSPSFNEENPATWGHLEPAYAPHNAHLYVEVRVKPGLYPAYLKFIAAKPEHEWPALYLHDLNEVYASMGAVEIPRYIPNDGVILPFTLAPYETAGTAADTAPAQIPGVKISLKWLSGKFGVSYEGLVKQQLNFLPYISTNYLYSDWDLGYETFKKAKFRLLSAAAGKVIDWEPAWETYVGIAHDPYSANAKSTVEAAGKKVYNYYGRIDPAPRCDGKPNVAYAE